MTSVSDTAKNLSVESGRYQECISGCNLGSDDANSDSGLDVSYFQSKIRLGNKSANSILRAKSDSGIDYTKDVGKMSIGDKITYTYIKRIKRWMKCPVCHDKMTFSKSRKSWICSNCAYGITEKDFLDDFVFWFCDECNSYLNNQEGFEKGSSKHICRNCGFENDTTFDNIKGMCIDCGKVLANPDASLCEECKFERKQKAKEWLIKAGKVVGTAAVIAGAAYIASQASSSEEDNNYSPLPEDEDGDGGGGMRCANCGNTDENTLWDEGDTLYCSKCCHRTRIDDGKDDLVECPYCHRMRDRKAMYCRWCNDSTWQSSSKEEFEETDKILKDMGY